MTDKLFNSILENALRLLILLDENIMPQTLDRIYVMDFIATYSHSFGIGEYDLNGENPFKFSEFASKRELIAESLKELVLRGLAVPVNLNTGFTYVISADGEELCETLISEYATEYRIAVGKVIPAISDKDERELIHMVNTISSQSLEVKMHE